MEANYKSTANFASNFSDTIALTGSSYRLSEQQQPPQNTQQAMMPSGITQPAHGGRYVCTWEYNRGPRNQLFLVPTRAASEDHIVHITSTGDSLS